MMYMCAPLRPPTRGPSRWIRSMGPPGTAIFTLNASKSLPTSKLPVWSSRDKAAQTRQNDRSCCSLSSPVKLWSVINYKHLMFCLLNQVFRLLESKHFSTNDCWGRIKPTETAHLGCLPAWPVWTPPQRWVCHILGPGCSGFWMSPELSSQHPA